MSRATQGTATLRMASYTGRSPALARCSNLFYSPYFLRYRGPTTPSAPKRSGFGLFPVRSPLLGESFLFSLPTGTKMFQFPAFAHFLRSVTGLQPAGLSHSEILGSKVICTYPRLNAAYHVLHRLQEPRHPPYALSYLLSVPQLLREVSAESCTFGDFLVFLVVLVPLEKFSRFLPLLLNKFARFSGLPFFLADYGSISRKPFCCPIFQRSFATFSLLRGE